MSIQSLGEKLLQNSLLNFHLGGWKTVALSLNYIKHFISYVDPYHCILSDAQSLRTFFSSLKIKKVTKIFAFIIHQIFLHAAIGLNVSHD